MLRTFPSDTFSSLERKMASTFHDGLYTASMDHCPSEQLGDHWHTTAIVLSANVDEYDRLGATLDARLRGKGLPGKWNTAPAPVQQRFLNNFVTALEGTGVYAFAISAHGSSINTALPRLSAELGIEGIYKQFETTSGKRRVRIGPVFNCETNEKLEFDLPQSRAAMCVFIAHFVHRIKQTMFEVRYRQTGRSGHINWNFFADKFPGPQDKEMDLLFQILMSYGRDTGRILWGYFDTDEEQTTDLLTDHVVGALNAALLKFGVDNTRSQFPNTDDFYWERWVFAP